MVAGSPLQWIVTTHLCLSFSECEKCRVRFSAALTNFNNQHRRDTVNLQSDIVRLERWLLDLWKAQGDPANYALAKALNQWTLDRDQLSADAAAHDSTKPSPTHFEKQPNTGTQ